MIGFVMWFYVGFGQGKVNLRSTGAKVGTDGKQLLVIRRSRWSVGTGHWTHCIPHLRLLLSVQMAFVSLSPLNINPRYRNLDHLFADQKQ